jgi:hemolysin-activating ACP:hemolysin acyltransferase
MSSGYLCIAQNNGDVDYLRMAYLQALSCKLTQSLDNNFSVIVDKETYEQVTDAHLAVFDEIIVLKNDLATKSKIKMQNECQAFTYSPYKSTIKTECDMLFTADLSWLWNTYAQFTYSFTQTVYTYDGHAIDNRKYRKQFDENLMPNIYSAWTYFTYDTACKEIYDTMRVITDDWDYYRDNYLVNCRYDEPRTDEVYALALKILDVKPQDTGFGFVHMKPKLQNCFSTQPWHEQLNWDIQGDFTPIIGHYKQSRPLHYVEKTFLTDELLDRYEYEFNRRRDQGLVG